MLKIRFKLAGRKKRPFFKIVLVDSKVRRDGGVIEELGYYDPLTKYLSLDQEQTIKRIRYGAQLTEVVLNLFIKLGLINKN